MEPVTRISKYEIGRMLGRGGFGEIYAARDPELGREIAIKVLRGEHTQRPQLVQRFLQEARAAARINHPGIVTVFECGQTDAGVVYIAMELLAGETLAARIQREPLELPAIVSLTRQLAGALAAAHATGIVHRDLKPQNVFLVPDPDAVGGVRVKILDFGIAKLTDALGTSVQTHSMEMMGTPLYMSPEQCKSSATVDARSDIYALGCIVFELLACRTPFEGDPGELIAKHQLVAPPALHELVTGVPPELEALVAKMLAKAPADRPQTMTAVADALETVPATGTLVRLAPRKTPPPDQYAPTQAPGGTLTDPRAAQHAPTTPFRGGVPLAQMTPPTAPAPVAPPKRRSRTLLIVAVNAIIGAALVGLGAYVAGRGHSDEHTASVAADAQVDHEIVHDEVITPPVIVPPMPPMPPKPPKHTKDKKAKDDDRDGDDDDDDDDDARGSSGLAPGCEKYLQASIAAGIKGDTAALATAGTELAKCEGDTKGVAVSAAKKECAALLEAGIITSKNGDYGAALSSLESAYQCKPTPHIALLVATAACKVPDRATAKQWIAKLSPHDRAKVAKVCADGGVNLDDSP
ncbi:MAG TPA: serine/threonine-protein kinase [Kofleriaceae bacterium]